MWIWMGGYVGLVILLGLFFGICWDCGLCVGDYVCFYSYNAGSCDRIIIYFAWVFCDCDCVG